MRLKLICFWVLSTEVLRTSFCAHWHPAHHELGQLLQVWQAWPLCTWMPYTWSRRWAWAWRAGLPFPRRRWGRHVCTPPKFFVTLLSIAAWKWTRGIVVSLLVIACVTFSSVLCTDACLPLYCCLFCCLCCALYSSATLQQMYSFVDNRNFLIFARNIWPAWLFNQIVLLELWTLISAKVPYSLMY